MEITTSYDNSSYDNSSFDSNQFAGASVELFGSNTSTNVTPSYGYETNNDLDLRSYRPIRK